EASLGVTFPPLSRGPKIDRVEREAFTTQGRAVPARAQDENAIAFVSAGMALPKHEVMIADKEGKPVAERIEGLLWFRGASATSGYYKNEEATAQLFAGGPAHA